MLKIIMIFLLPFGAMAESKLFELKGEQFLMDAKDAEMLTPDAVLLWDEKKDGVLPKDAPIGYADRVESKPLGKAILVDNPVKKEAKDKRNAELAVKKLRAAEQAESLSLIEEKFDGAEKLTDEEIKLYLKSLKRGSQ